MLIVSVLNYGKRLVGGAGVEPASVRCNALVTNNSRLYGYRLTLRLT